MKIIKLHNTQKSLIKKASNNNREAQEQLFAQHAPKMLGVCRQYVKDLHHAEDLLLQGFLKVFTNLYSFKHEGSFEGWIRRIMVNTCISYLRKKNLINLSDEEYVFDDAATESLENTSVEDIQKLIDQLPEGYKMVFNLFAIEGYKHSEIAEKLGVSESTSKSQLFKARKVLQQNYIKMNRVVDENK
ncbi:MULTISPECIES: RNA polymerase sigma factor [unclassified Polaribacter]|uniref:RNA polymerase sigma factor n=1 Tax=unclassified Polaribacter TaxID=196858 RepID=UPI0011BF999C|nr:MULTISPECIES: sigma-70 family RNA polymerase sigma factor [unclassified Polaribacter]TXD50804.1 sigma-70 family RNA polymerase sigma factor [Polaribacter sp. IC063]TXD57540.1 sigma-70 family RNA polymerase sigma factor [Polaribacter sp. IC066]